MGGGQLKEVSGFAVEFGEQRVASSLDCTVGLVKTLGARETAQCSSVLN